MLLAFCCHVGKQPSVAADVMMRTWRKTVYIIEVGFAPYYLSGL
ncbi:hypothetical protein HMPREF0541_00443 [Lacticaseibacillus rhamnosus ATCC 21052]|nr:hypothetical protein HMPREF0541_00443 [Lacticaseibacillus rhamnosus ATCC 21052]